MSSRPILKPNGALTPERLCHVVSASHGNSEYAPGRQRPVIINLRCASNLIITGSVLTLGGNVTHNTSAFAIGPTWSSPIPAVLWNSTINSGHNFNRTGDRILDISKHRLVIRNPTSQSGANTTASSISAKPSALANNKATWRSMERW